MIKRKLLRTRVEGVYRGEYCTIERRVRDETNDYGRAGEVEWHVIRPDGEPIDVLPTLAQAREVYGI